MTFHRIAAVFALAVALAPALIACGGGGGSSPTSATPTPQPVPPPPAASAPTVAVTARGAALGPVTELLVTAAGGALRSADGRVSVMVPAGALPAGTRISVQAIGNESPGGAGLGYRLLPEGLSFAAPVSISFHYDDGDTAGSTPAALKIAYQDGQGRWNAVRALALDTVAKTVTVQALHFSDWSMLKGFQLTPGSASLGAGRAIDLAVVHCFAKDSASGEETDLLYTCGPLSIDWLTDNWSVNGIDGGSVALGQVSSPHRDALARYTAPNTPPASNPVSVSVQVTNDKGARTLLVANIWVDSFPPLTGNITSTQVSQLGTATMTHTTTANVTFKYATDEQVYRPTSGTVVSHLDMVDPFVGCEYHVSYAGAIGLQDGFIRIEEDGHYIADATTAAPHVGTTTCGTDHKVQPLTLDPAGAHWWPAPPPSASEAAEMQVLRNGTLAESISWTSGAGGTATTVRWSLSPLP